MRITHDGIKKMIDAIVMDERFGTEGHHCGENRAFDLIHGLKKLLNEDEFDLPDLPHVLTRGSLAEDISRGYSRPLGYLCSDCRYPKWAMTAGEVRAEGIAAYVARVKDLADDAFTDVTGACPRCGD